MRRCLVALLLAGHATLAHGHAPLRQQLDRQRVCGTELDLFGDPQGGLYDQPLVRSFAGLGPLTDPAYQQPGTKVPGRAARYDSDFFGALPGGLTARCNPLIAPRGRRSGRPEPASLR
jgi:hypothetical protein